MMIPLWVDEVKDKKLIDFLKEQTNRSAFIRDRIYDYMRGISWQTKVTEESVEESFIDSLNGFEG